MCTSREETLGKCVPNMAQTIISKCSRTWNQELRIGVLHRALEPRLSVWDCIPEYMIDAHVKDAFEYLPEHRDYILHYAIPGSAVVRSIRRLDGYRSSPLVLKSLHFCSEGEVDAYHFPEESDFTLDFSELEYAEDSNISRESTPVPASISELEDNEIHITTGDDDSELEDEADRGKPEQWTDYSESEDVEICTSPQQPALDEDYEAISPEPRELSIIWECDEELEDGHYDNEPAESETNGRKPQQLSPSHQPQLEFDIEQHDERLEAESPEPRRAFPFRHESPVPEYDDDERDDESVDTGSPAPRRLFPVHQFHSTVYDPQQQAPQMETYCPAPLRRFLTPEERLKFDAFEDWFVRMNGRTAIVANSEKSNSGTTSPEPRRLFPFRRDSPVQNHDDDEKDDKSLSSDSPEPRRLFPVHQFHSTVYDPPQQAPQMETYCPAPLRRFLMPEERLKFDAFEDWFVRMSERTATNASPETPISKASSSPFRNETPVPDYDNDEKDEEPESPEPRRLFPVHQFHSAAHDYPQTAPEMETFCPGPLRRFLTPEERLKFDAFEDWFVDMHMSKRADIDESLEKFISETSSTEPRRFFPVHQSQSWLNEPKRILECNDEANEKMEFIPVESLRV